MAGHRLLFVRAAAFVLAATFTATVVQGDDPPQPEMIAGKADLLRHVPKKFATLRGIDVERRRIALSVEGEDEERIWPVNSDAELKLHGWWGRLEQFQTGDRVWVWFSLDRKKQPKSVLMLADEMSAQDIHGEPPLLKAIAEKSRALSLETAAGDKRTLNLAEGIADDVSGLVDQKVFLQSVDGMARTIVSGERFEELRRQQRAWLRDKWRAEGLPGYVSILHPLGGELEVMLDHEGMQWGRYLKPGDKVTLHLDRAPADAAEALDDAASAAVEMLVKHARPWRERTQLRLVTNTGVDQADLALGGRVHIVVPEPPQEVQDSDLPSDIGRLSGKSERVEWFIASIYCSCSIGEDSCTGMFYSLASCNVIACGMPNTMRGRIGKMIDQGMKDEEIWREMREQSGPLLIKPHLKR